MSMISYFQLSDYHSIIDLLTCRDGSQHEGVFVSRTVSVIIRYTAWVDIVIALLSNYTANRTAIVDVIVIIDSVVDVDVVGVTWCGGGGSVSGYSAMGYSIFIGHNTVHRYVATIDAVIRYYVMVVIVDICYYARCVGVHVAVIVIVIVAVIVQCAHVEVTRQ